MAIARDNSTTVSGNGSPFTTSFTCSGENRLLVVGVMEGVGELNVTSMTYNGDSLTKIGDSLVDGDRYVSLYVLIAPDTGANNLVVNYNNSFLRLFISSYTGVKQTSQPEVYDEEVSSGVTTSYSDTITTTSDNNWLVSAVKTRYGTISASTGASLVTGLGNQMALFDSNEAKSPSGSYTMNYSTTIIGSWASVVMAIAPAVTSTGWYNSSWQYRKKITVDDAKISGSANLTDFPVYLDLSELGSNFFDNVKSDGADIRITTSDGETEVPREVVSVDTTNDEGEVHFKGTLSYSADTDFYIYYGNSSATEPSASATYGSQNVWKSSYKAVLHDCLDDSTSNSNDFTNNGTTETTGQIGEARSYDGTNDYIGKESAILGTSISSDVRISAIIKKTASTANTEMWIVDTSQGYEANGTSKLSLSYVVGDGEIRFQSRTNNFGTRKTVTGTTSISNDTYYYVVGVVDSSGNMKLYINGEEEGTSTAISNTTSFSRCSIGAERNDGGENSSSEEYFWKGVIDEVKYEASCPSADWIKTEYNNQSSASTFYTIGSQEQEGGTVNTTNFNFFN